MTAYTPNTGFAGGKAFVTTSFQLDYGRMLAAFSDALQQQDLVEGLGGWTVATRDVHDKADDAWTDFSVQIDELMSAMRLTAADHRLHHSAGLIRSALMAPSPEWLFSFWNELEPFRRNPFTDSPDPVGCEGPDLLKRTLVLLDIYCRQMLRLVEDDILIACDGCRLSGIAIA